MEREGQPGQDLKEEPSRHTEEQVQRPWGGNEQGPGEEEKGFS